MTEAKPFPHINSGDVLPPDEMLSGDSLYRHGWFLVNVDDDWSLGQFQRSRNKKGRWHTDSGRVQRWMQMPPTDEGEVQA